jgi:hypothetical protein
MTHSSKRTGPFWDAIEGRIPLPRAAATLGLEFIDADVEQGMIVLAFTATEDFTNPMGNVLGAFLAAMLYDTVGPALLATLDPDQFQSTLQLNTSFLRPVPLAGSSDEDAWCTTNTATPHRPSQADGEYSINLGRPTGEHARPCNVSRAFWVLADCPRRTRGRRPVDLRCVRSTTVAEEHARGILR